MQNNGIIRERRLPFRARQDLVVQPLFARGFRFCVVKDPLALRYWKLDPAQYQVLSWLDGATSLESLRQKLQAGFPEWHITLHDIQQLVLDLQKKGLLVTGRAFQATTLLSTARDRRMRSILSAIQNPLFIRLPGVDPNAFLTWLYSFVGWCLHPAILFSSALFMIGTWVLIYIRRDEIWQQLPSFEQFFAWPNVMYLWIVLGATKIVHELGHGLATKRIGRDCHTIGAALLVLSPTMYCDATDSWMVASKWKRIAVAAAGMYIEILLASSAFLLWSMTMPGVLKHLLLNIFFVSTITTVIFNANPLIRFDGYYMLSDWLEIPNLSEESNQLLQRAWGWCFGLHIENTSRTTAPTWILVAYGIASFVYRWVLLLSIALGLYVMLKPYKLQSIGVSLAVFVVGGSLYRLVRGGQQIYQRHSKQEPVHRGRCALTVVVLLALITGVLLVPIPLYRSSPIYAEPDGIRHVYAVQPGKLVDTRVRSGELVTTGRVLAILENTALEDRIRDLETQRRAAYSELLTSHRADDHATYVAKYEEAAQLQALLEEAKHQAMQATIRAPAAGVVIWPERVPRATLEQRETTLSAWADVPLHRQNLGCALEPGTHLCSIAPRVDSYVAKLVVDQQDRNDLKVGSRLRIKFDATPLQVVTGYVTGIAKQQSEVVPRLMSLKRGGQIATVTDSMGQERLGSNAYLVTASLVENSDLPLRTAMRGQARFLVRNRTAGQWIWRWIRSTFSFRI